MEFIEIAGPREEVLQKLGELGIENETFVNGMNELGEVLKLLEADGFSGAVRADMKIVRGLDYYTGTVFEFNLPEYRQVGSVCGGGRYENLTGYFSDQKFPGVGGSIGLTRLFYVLAENNLVKSQTEKPLDLAVVPISDHEIEFAMKVATEFREKGEKVTLVATNKRLGDKMKYASSVAKRCIVLGEDEVKNNSYRIKEFN